MAEWSYYEIRDTTNYISNTARDTQKILEAIETLTNAFNQSNDKIAQLEETVSALKDEISELKEPKKTSISFAKKKN